MINDKLRQFGIRLEQRELFIVLYPISFYSLRLVVKETVCPECGNEIHYEVVDRPVS